MPAFPPQIHPRSAASGRTAPPYAPYAVYEPVSRLAGLRSTAVVRLPDLFRTPEIRRPSPGKAMSATKSLFFTP
jgi:hypothetical protein